MLRAVAFDVDSTLTDFLRYKRLASDAAALAMVDAGLDLDPTVAQERLWEIYREAGLDDDVAFRRFLQSTVGRVESHLMEAAIHAYLRAKDAHLEPFPRTLDTLIALVRRGLRLAVVTDAPREKAMRRLAALRLRPFFETVITRDDTLRGKADEAPYRLLLKRLALPPGEVLMVGDNPERDVRPAKRVGLPTALAEYGCQPHFATRFPFDEPDHRLRRIDDLVAVVDRLGAPLAWPPAVAAPPGPLAAALAAEPRPVPAEGAGFL